MQWILSNRLTDFECHLISLALHKGSSTNSGYYISIVNIGSRWYQCHNYVVLFDQSWLTLVWYQCDDVKITSLTISVLK